MTEPTIAETLARRIAAVTPAMLPPALRVIAEDLVLDVAGLCLAARRSDYVGAVLAGWDDGGLCTVIGHRQTRDAAGSALVNGTAAHGEDFDDTFEGGPVHAGAVIVPAVLAAAERFGRDGNAVLLGIAIGVETICRLSTVAPTMVHRAGFHPTSVFGTLAAAAAVSATLGLDERATVHAIGIAGSMAGGLIEYLADGAWTKRLHPGWAAQAGLRAALFARHGFIGPRSVLEGTHGLFFGFAHSKVGDYDRLIGDFGRHWVGETLAFKPYACGTMIHPFIDCAIRLARRGIALEAIESITCAVGEGTVHRLWEPLALKRMPPNAYAAKFSTPFCIAAGFVLQDGGLAAFTEATVRDRRILDLAAKVGYVIDPANPYPRQFTGHVKLRLRNGTEAEERQPYLRGGAQEKLSRADIETKFFANAAFGGVAREEAAAARALAARIFAGPLDLAAFRI
jgi:2-methylcitrate dehydratase PrpD